MSLIRPATAEDLTGLVERAAPRDIAGGPQMADEIRRAIEARLAYVIVDDVGTVIGAAGIIPVGPGVGHAWALFLPAAKRLRTFGEVHRMCSRFLGILLERRFHRIQASVVVGFSSGCKWIERLGMQREGVIRQMDAVRQDHIMYSMVRET